MAGKRSPWGGDKPEAEAANEPGSAPPGDDGDSRGDSGGDTTPDKAPAGKGDAPPPSPGPRNPWLPGGESPPPRRSASIEDIFRGRGDGQRRRGFGGGGFRLPQRPDGKSWFPLIVAGIVGVWLLATTVHQIGSNEEGIVTTFGKYSHTITSGVSLTLPWPIQDVSVTDVTSIRRDTIPEDEGEKLMLTSDKNLVDLSYLVRWNIKNLKLYKYQLEDPAETVKEVAEAAMRSAVAEVPLTAVMGGAGRAIIEQNVRQRMQAILDAYHAGVLVQGVDLKKADPPSKVVASFQKVTVAQQEAQRDLSQAEAWAQQVVARAEGDAAAFEKVYAQYKLAPDVTRQRMYYETMERVLANNDKVVLQNPGGVTSYLPLPEIRRKSQSGDGAASPASGAP
ncbi:MAG: protease modulator HflK [Novosphingobium sp.]|nr:protease modulator HflK [Novosphingobium sp.]